MMKKLKKIFALLLSVLLLLNLAACSGNGDAKAESWPSEPINILVPASAGGGTDIIVRIIAEHITQRTKQPVVITNVSGVPAYEQGKDQEPNGYNYMVVMNHLFTGLANGTMTFGYEAFDAVANVATDYSTGIVVRADSPYQTLNDLMEAIAADPRGVVGGTSLSGYSLCVAMAMKKALNLDIYWVDSGSASDRSVALMGGQVDFISSNYTSVKPYLESGDFRFLAIPYENRDPSMPDVPTFQECGYDFAFVGQDIFLAAPKGTDEKYLDAMNALLNEIYADEAFLEDVSAYSMVFTPMTREEVEAGMAQATDVLSPFASTTN